VLDLNYRKETYLLQIYKDESKESWITFKITIATGKNNYSVTREHDPYSQEGTSSTLFLMNTLSWKQQCGEG
jgi:hypothetical protein